MRGSERIFLQSRVLSSTYHRLSLGEKEKGRVKSTGHMGGLWGLIHLVWWRVELFLDLQLGGTTHPDQPRAPARTPRGRVPSAPA